MACGVYEAVIHTAHASDQELPNVLWTVTDALTVKAMGGGVVLYHPSLGILRQLFFRFQVTVATSADAKWLPKLVARYMLRKWLGHAHFIADATAALHGTHTNFSPPSTYTNHIYRRVVAATAANCTDADQREYLESGAHCAIDKDARWPEMVKLLARAYADRMPRPSAGTTVVSARPSVECDACISSQGNLPGSVDV